MSLRSAVVAQFKRPHGPVGRLAGQIMAARPSNRARNLWTLDLLDIQPGDRVLEIGCGPGFALAAAAARAGEGKVVGLDHSETMLSQARARNRSAIAEGRIELRLGDAAAPPAEAGPFDKAYSVNVVQFLPDPEGAFRALYVAMAPGGAAAATYMPRGKDPSRAAALSKAEEIRGHMEAAGFSDVRIEELPLKPVLAVCVLGRRPSGSE